MLKILERDICAKKESSAYRIAACIDTCSPAVAAEAYFGVGTGVLGECAEVLYCSICTQTLERTVFPDIFEIITKSDVGNAEIIAVLNIDIGYAVPVVLGRSERQTRIAVRRTFAMPAILDNVHCIGVFALIGEVSVRFCNLLTESTYSGDSEIESLIPEVKIDTEVHIRMGIAYFHTVGIGDASVAVCIYKPQVAWHCARTDKTSVGITVCVDFRLVLEYAVGFVAIEEAYGVAYLYARDIVGTAGQNLGGTVDNAFVVGKTCNLVLVIAQVYRCAVGEITYMIVPCKGEFNTAITYVATVDVRSAGTVGSEDRGYNEPVLCSLDIVVEDYT